MENEKGQSIHLEKQSTSSERQVDSRADEQSPSSGRHLNKKEQIMEMTLEEEQALKIIEKTFEQTEDIIELLDQKANMLLLVHTVTVLLLFDLLSQYRNTFPKGAIGRISFSSLIISSLIVFLAILVTTWYIIRPRDTNKISRKKGDEYIKNLSLTHFLAPTSYNNVEEYLGKAYKCSHKEYIKGLAIQLKRLSEITRDKSKWVRRTVNLLIFYTIFLAIGMFFFIFK